MSEIGFLEWSLFAFFLIQCWWVDEAGDGQEGGRTSEGVCRRSVYFHTGVVKLF